MQLNPTRHPLNQPYHWWHRYKMSSQKFAVILTMAAFVTGFAYVALTNASAANGFAIEKLQRDLTELKSANEKMQVETAGLRSLAAADVAGRALGLVPSERFDVLPSAGGAVAAR